MEVLEVYPKDWYVKLELGFKELLQLLDFLDKCEFQGDLKDEKMVLANDFVTKKFFPELDKLADQIMTRRDF